MLCSCRAASCRSHRPQADRAEDRIAPEKEGEYLLPGPDVPEIRFADGTVGEAYEQTFSMSNDNDPSDKFYFVMRDPEYSPLPPGLGLAKEGVISGVPTQQGEYTFELCGVGRDEECTIIDGKMNLPALKGRVSCE